MWQEEQSAVWLDAELTLTIYPSACLAFGNHKTNTWKGAKHAARADFFLNKQRSSPAAVTLNKEREWIAPLAASASIIKEVTSHTLIEQEKKGKWVKWSLHIYSAFKTLRKNFFFVICHFVGSAGKKR